MPTTISYTPLADTLLISTDTPPPTGDHEVYREKIAPTSQKKLESYTVETLLGRLSSSLLILLALPVRARSTTSLSHL